MSFALTQKLSSTNPFLLFPLIQSDGLERRVRELARRAGIDENLLAADFQGKLREVTLLYPPNFPGRRWALIGLGSEPGPRELIGAIRAFLQKRGAGLPERVGISLLEGGELLNTPPMLEALVIGWLTGRYRVGKYKTGSVAEAPREEWVEIACGEVDAARKKALRWGGVLAEAQQRLMDLVNAPANRKSAESLAECAREAGRRFGFEVRVWGKRELRERGMDALLAVNRGSERPPTFTVLEYRPEGVSDAPKIGLAGKGVLFDTGGVSLKPSSNMHLMKSDMGGAAVVLGVFEAVARMRLPVQLVGAVPATDNLVDACSIKPGDVIGSYSGKTIEIIDTDAEGRLLLADALSYLNRNHQPHFLLDLATLTGSVVRTFGKEAAALFSNDDTLAEQLLQAGMETGEKLWRLPLWKEYAPALESDIADIKNYSGKPIAGAITAAKFLEVFTEGHPRWAHLDIAGVALNNSDFGAGKSATAFGLHLLCTFLRRLIQ